MKIFPFSQSAEECNITEAMSRIKHTCTEGSRQDVKAEEQRTIVYAKLVRLNESIQRNSQTSPTRLLYNKLNVKSHKARSILSDIVNKD